MMKKILIILFVFGILFTISACNDPDEGNDNEPVIPTLTFLETTYTMKIDDQVTLEPVIGNTEDILTVSYQVSVTGIVEITNGVMVAKASGQTEVIATLIDYDVSVTISVTVEEEEEPVDPTQIALQKIEKIKTELDVIIPSEAVMDFTLPKFMENYQVKLTWITSDADAIDKSGRIQRTYEDQEVLIGATIQYKGVTGEFMKAVTVKKLSFDSIGEKKLTFAYLFDSTYKPMREEDLEKIDVINYSFGHIIGGKLATYHLVNFRKALQLAQSKGVRVVLAIGGWGGGGFSEACSTETSRGIFIQSIVDFIKENNINGIDIDWEYPTSSAAGITSSDADYDNLTYFIRDLRTAMDQIRPDLIISMAVAGGAYAAGRYYDVRELNKYLDYFHIMSYDLIDYTSSITTHHANLFTSHYSTGSADSAIKAYVSNGASPEKIMLGIAFYGHIGTVTVASENGMLVKGEGLSKSVTFTEIKNKYLTNTAFIEYFDENAKAAWLYDGTTFITFDNPLSIAYKCDYVNFNDLGGVMFWDLNSDTTGTLVDAIYNNLNK